MPQATFAEDLTGRPVLDRSGEKIGEIDELYADLPSGRPEWARVHSGLFGMRHSFVPIRDAKRTEEGIQVPVTKQQAKDAPSVDADGELSEEEERALFEHYNIPFGADDAAGTGDSRGPAAGADDAMTRSEEELHVGTARREAGQARLHKYVVTEEEQRTVPVEREEVRVEHEPITDANREEALSGPEITEAEHQVTLHEEEPVVEKRTVPRERVHMEKESHGDEREVSAELRKERIEEERN